MRGSRLLAVAVLAIPTAAVADDTASRPLTDHKGQWGVSARLGLGVRGIATYDENDYCGAIDQEDGGFASVCSGATPLALNLEASYGVAPSIELALELGIGLQTDFGPTEGADGPRPVSLAFGGRFSFSEATRTKLFVQPMIVADLTDRPQGNDFGVRGLQGLWIDLSRRYGGYVFVAETIEFSRWLSFAFELGIGFQGRYP